GTLHESDEQSGGPGKGLIRRVHRFAALKLRNIRGFEFQARGYSPWALFQHVSLQPGQKTQVSISTRMEDPGGTASGPTRAAMIQELISRLGHAQFSERQAAMKRLEEIGEEANPALGEAAARAPDPELRRRLDELIRNIESKACDRLFNDALHEERVTKDYD